MHSHSTTIVTEVDPDAPTRQRKNLELEDAVYEQNFTKTLFEYIRRGRIDHAMNLCVESDQSWRAASLRGGILHQDPSLDDEIFSGIVEMKVPIGNRDRHLWKGTCYQFAQEETSDKYERAMYAALCGDVDHVLPVCTSWEDIVWTHYNALIESRIEKHLRRHGKMIHSELPVPTSADDLTVEEIFDRAKQSEPDDWRGSAVFPFHIIQAMIILNQTRPLIESMTDNLGAILQDPVHEASQPHMLRFMAHFISYLRSISVELDDAKADYIMQSYVELLIASRKNRIVALYATKLPHDLQVECYASFLTTINDEKRVRWEHVNIAYHYGLDVKTILVRTVEKIFSQAHSQEPELSGPEEALMLTKINDNIEPGDKVQIRALEWLTFEQSQHEDALYHSNSLIRHFLVSGKINAAREVMETLPHNLIFEEWTIDSDAHDDYSSLLKAVKEHLNYKNFLHCLDLYAQWAGLLYAKPSITGDSGLHMQQLNDWKANMRSKTRETEQELRRLLQSYWLMECYDKSDGEGMEACDPLAHDFVRDKRYHSREPEEERWDCRAGREREYTSLCRVHEVQTDAYAPEIAATVIFRFVEMRLAYNDVIGENKNSQNLELRKACVALDGKMAKSVSIFLIWALRHARVGNHASHLLYKSAIPRVSISPLSHSPTLPHTCTMSHIPTVDSLDKIYDEKKILSEGVRYNNLVIKFETVFGRAPEFITRSPGRVNLIGEHIDYAGFGVLPMAVDRDVIMAVATHHDNSKIRIANVSDKYPKREFDFEGKDEVVTIDSTVLEWSNYFKCGYKVVPVGHVWIVMSNHGV
ncbi:107-domain-containing protein [Jimgerdemannia flammicorona]|uniref:Nuclear pore complex protein n=1 Tax=Jimgerdemannia flammicorona TaxID=994334 RepID=A0A433C2S7_9FUNG|nr:107-domain-containing protein [Jimgerdemannia flammicorona]